MKQKYTLERNKIEFWRRVHKDGSIPLHAPELGPCWEWEGACTGTMGYGAKVWEGQLQYTHRISWLIAYGFIPHGMLVLHKCDNPKCVNPDHLFLGTFKTNSDDMNKKGRRADTHQKDKKARIVNISDEQALEIRTLYQTGHYKLRELAERYAIPISSVYHSATRRKLPD